MKILHVDTGRELGGGQKQVLHLARGLVERGTATKLVLPPGSELARRAGERGIPVEPLRMRGEWDILAAMRIARLFLHGGFDLLHLHTARAHTLGFVAAGFASIPAILVSRRELSRPKPLLIQRLKYGSQRIRYLAISEAVRSDLIRVGARPEQITLVRSGIDLEARPRGNGEALRRVLGIDPGATLIGSAGRLEENKGFSDLIRAFSLLRRDPVPLKLVIAGEGSRKAALADEARSLGLQNEVVLPGFLEDMPGFLDSLAVYVQPSHREPLGTALLEAMAAGIPVIATESGGIPEYLESGKDGLLVPPRDPGELSRAIERLVAGPEEAERMARNARERVEREYSKERMIAETIAAYRRTVNGERGAS